MAGFWDSIGNAVPGMLQTGVNFFGQKQAAQGAEDELRKAQGPLYAQTQQMAGNALNMAGSMDPKAAAAERYQAQQNIVAPNEEAQRLKILRELQAKGQTGVASHAPVAGAGGVPGVAGQPGAPINPQLAAFYAAQQAGRNTAAYNSLNEGENQINRMLDRSGMLQKQAQGQQSTGQLARRSMPKAPSIGSTLLQGASGLLSNPGMMSAIAGGAKDLFGGLFGGGGLTANPDFGTAWATPDYYDPWSAGSWGSQMGGSGSDYFSMY